MNDINTMIPFGVLVAIFATSWPKRWAIIICMFVSLACVGMDYLTAEGFFASKWLLYWAILGIEAVGFMSLMTMVHYFEKAHDRFFTRLMAVFLLASSGVTAVFIISWIEVLGLSGLSYSHYVHASNGVGVAHVLAMLGYSDHARNLVDNLRRVGMDWRAGLGRLGHYFRRKEQSR